MNDSIYTIPISDVFEPKDGCPICRLRNMLETRCIDYILGAAMMEPDVRIQTNEQGFCDKHFKQMFKNRNKLSLALMLQSHLDSIAHDIFDKKDIFNPSAKAQKVHRLQQNCFVCNQIDTAMDKLLGTVFKMWDSGLEFKELFRAQPQLCLEHFDLLCRSAEKHLPRRKAADFYGDCEALVKPALARLREDVTHFTTMFDYRNSGENADWKNSRDSIQRAIAFLTSYRPD